MRQEQQQGNTGDKCTLMANVKSARLKHNKRAKRILTPLVVVIAVTMLPLSILRVTIVLWPEIIGKEYQGRRSRGGWGGFSPPTFEEDDILFCFNICSYSRKYIRVFAR